MTSLPFHLGLTGYPLGHSLSPRLHAAALEQLGLEGEYRLYPVPPLPEGAAGLAALAARLRGGELHGLNVTIPYKQAVLPLVDELSLTARAIGAANTLYLRDGRLVGDNTDVPGFLADLQAQLGEHLAGRPRRALVLGAGGSARAVVYALASTAWQVTVAARHVDQAQSLIADLRPALPTADLRACLLSPSSLINSSQIDCSLLVNSTPLGMSPHPDASPWPAELPLPREAAVYDLVYNPRQTRLVGEARTAGLPAASGLGMLVEQAVLAFELWTGFPASREAMYQAVEG